jgi:hypothetical protein
MTVFARARHFLFIFGYLWLLLSVFTLHNSLVLSDWELTAHIGAATLKALVFAKFILIGEHLRLGARAERLPLVWLVPIKAALFSVLLIGLNLLEEELVAAIWPHAERGGDGLDLSTVSAIVSVSVMAFIALVPFFGIRELGNAIGEDKMRELFLRRPE